MKNLFRMAFAVGLILSSHTAAWSQQVVLIKAIPIYGWNNAFEGAAGYSFGAHTHFDKIGFHANYYHGYTKPESNAFYKQHKMVDGTVSFRFGHSDDGEDDKARL